MSFEQEIVLTIIDKAVLGAVIVVLGLLANRALERFKTREALRKEIVQRRVEKVAELWQALNSLERKYLALLHERLQFETDVRATASNRNAEWRTQVQERVAQLESDTRRLGDLIVENRFWLGKSSADSALAEVSGMRALLGRYDEKVPHYWKEHRERLERVIGDVERLLAAVKRGRIDAPPPHLVEIIKS